MTTPRIWRVRFDWTKPPLSNNGRYHWAKKAKIKTQIREEVAERVLAAGVPKLGFFRLGLIYHVGSSTRRDPINLTDLLKVMQDALTVDGKGATAGIIADDTAEYIDTRMPTIEYTKGQKPYFELEIEECQ